MHVAGLRLVNFRSYCDATVHFGPGLNIVVGANATGKTNLLEGAWFALRGASPRTRREEKLVTWGAQYLRAELSLVDDAGVQTVELGYAPGQGKRLRWDGVELSSAEELRRRSQVFIFVPESLLLVKGSPARRRAHLDVFAAALDPGYAAAVREFQEASRQRNAALQAVRQGASQAGLDPWDRQFARAAAELSRRRRGMVAEIAVQFAEAAASLTAAEQSFTLELVTQLKPRFDDEAELREELRRRRPGEIQRGMGLFGPQRDDLRFLEVEEPDGRQAAAPVDDEVEEAAGEPGRSPAFASRPVIPEQHACGPVELPSGGRDLRLFGSQGEQRAAVLALLLAEQQVATAHGAAAGALFLDDVMSELDDSRRRLLVRMLAGAGQAIITTTNRGYFTDDELARATIIALPLRGSLAAGAEPVGATGVVTAPGAETPLPAASDGRAATARPPLPAGSDGPPAEDAL